MSQSFFVWYSVSNPHHAHCNFITFVVRMYPVLSWYPVLYTSSAMLQPSTGFHRVFGLPKLCEPHTIYYWPSYRIYFSSQIRQYLTPTVVHLNRYFTLHYSDAHWDAHSMPMITSYRDKQLILFSSEMYDISDQATLDLIFNSHCLLSLLLISLFQKFDLLFAFTFLALFLKTMHNCTLYPREHVPYHLLVRFSCFSLIRIFVPIFLTCS